jgi:hypothetical protein
MKIDKQTLIVVGAATAIGFIGDALTFSIAQSEGKPFKFVLPKGKSLMYVLLGGVISGFFIDAAVKSIERKIVSDEERMLLELADLEREKVRTGKLKGYSPKGIMWELVAKTA